MLTSFIQFLLSGLTLGAAYALAGLGFTLIYNASGVINFAQGEFIMLGGMLSVALLQWGLSLPLAVALAVALTALAGMAMEWVAIEPAKDADVVSLIIITIGASLVIRGIVQVTLGKGSHVLPAFSGDAPIAVLGATVLPQSLWVIFVTLITVLLLVLFFARTRTGKAMLATAHNRLAARLVGINVRTILLLSFGMSALLGAVGGALLAPITFTSYDAGILLGLKGFVGAVLGGLGGPAGAVLGGFLVGLAESFAAGYVSSAYKDAVPFMLIFLVLFFRPSGLFGKSSTERV